MWGNSLADGGFLNSFIQSFCHHICKCNFSSICEVCGHSGVMNTTVRRKKVLVVQSCLILCDPMDCSPPGSSVYGILQARILEWIAIPFSRGSSQPRNQTFTIWATRDQTASVQILTLPLGLLGKLLILPYLNFLSFRTWLVVVPWKVAVMI